MPPSVSRFVLRAVTPMLLSVGVTACLPIPHRIYDSPSITARLERTGAPVPGAVVRLADLEDGGSCSKPVAEAVTDSGGRFAFRSRTHWSPFFVLLPVHQTQNLVLCLAPADGPGQEFAWIYSYQMGEGPRALELRCDLARLVSVAGTDSAHVARVRLYAFNGSSPCAPRQNAD